MYKIYQLEEFFNKEEFSRQQRDNSDVGNNRNDNLNNYTRIMKHPQYY
jgi:hypothetical protein